MSQIIYFGTVMSVYDENNGNRIKAKIPLDGPSAVLQDIPYAFPLLPKTMQVTPKVGEMVFIILANPELRTSPRYYVGPIISQPQKMYEEKKGKNDNPAKLINHQTVPLETLDHFTETFGAFPKLNDIGLIGRKSEDIILKDDEIDIRCGIRNSADGSGSTSVVGDILFNSSNPAYIQLKHQRKGYNTDNLVNLVGGKINFMSTEDAQTITNSMKNYNNVDISKIQNKKDSMVRVGSGATKAAEELKILEDSPNMYEEPDYEAIMAQLHQIPYGDVLVEVLETMREAILHHTHRWAQEEPTKEDVECMAKLQTWGQSTDVSKSVDLGEVLLSDTVRIS